MKNILLLMLLVLMTAVCQAQTKKLKFHSLNSVAMTAGESRATAAYETINGFEFSTWFAGLGVGLDNYHFKSIPVFMDTRKYLGSNKLVFLFGNIGADCPAQKQAAKEFTYHDYYYFKPGIYADAGIGYRFAVIKKPLLVFSLSNSYKSMHARTGVYTECLIAPCPVTFKDYHYNFYRLMVRAGLMF
jgi:hypothetical protein